MVDQSLGNEIRMSTTSQPLLLIQAPKPIYIETKEHQPDLTNEVSPGALMKELTSGALMKELTSGALATELLVEWYFRKMAMDDRFSISICETPCPATSACADHIDFNTGRTFTEHNYCNIWCILYDCIVCIPTFMIGGLKFGCYTQKNNKEANGTLQVIYYALMHDKGKECKQLESQQYRMCCFGCIECCSRNCHQDPTKMGPCGCCVGKELMPKLTDDELKVAPKNNQVVTYITGPCATMEDCQKKHQDFYNVYIKPKFPNAHIERMNNAIWSVVSDMRSYNWPFLFGKQFIRAILQRMDRPIRV